MRVLALAESDAYLKWAAWLLEQVPWERELCLVDSPISPSPRQIHDALSATGMDELTPQRLGVVGLRRRIAATRPDAVLLALAGPTLALVTAALPHGPSSPVRIAGIPGVALPVRDRALRARLGIDVFVTHSRRERDEYQAAFATVGAPTRVALGTLPFLHAAAGVDELGVRPDRHDGVGRVLFAAQPSVPTSREERTQLLELLAALGPPPPVVKLRGEDGERATHHEAHPYPVLWRAMVAAGRARAGDVDFATGSLAGALDTTRCLVTVSSTAALEAIARRLPVVIASDFGVSDVLLNDLFTGSGLIAPITRAAVDGAALPDGDWATHNYFHPAADDDWIGIVEELASRERTARHRPRDRRYVAAATRSVARVGLAGVNRRMRAGSLAVRARRRPKGATTVAMVASPMQAISLREAVHAGAIATPDIVVVLGPVAPVIAVLDLGASDTPVIDGTGRRRLSVLTRCDELVLGDPFSRLGQLAVLRRGGGRLTILEDGAATLRAHRLLALGLEPLIRTHGASPSTGVLAAAAGRRVRGLARRGHVTVVAGLPMPDAVEHGLRAGGFGVVRHTFGWARSVEVAPDPATQALAAATRIVLGSALAVDGHVDSTYYRSWLDRALDGDAVVFLPHRRERDAAPPTGGDSGAILLPASDLPAELRLRDVEGMLTLDCLPTTAALTVPLVRRSGCTSVRVTAIPADRWTPSTPPSMVALADEIATIAMPNESSPAAPCAAPRTASSPRPTRT